MGQMKVAKLEMIDDRRPGVEGRSGWRGVEMAAIDGRSVRNCGM